MTSLIPPFFPGRMPPSDTPETIRNAMTSKGQTDSKGTFARLVVQPMKL